MLKCQCYNEIIKRLDVIITILNGERQQANEEKQNPLKQVKSSGILEWLDSRNNKKLKGWYIMFGLLKHKIKRIKVIYKNIKRKANSK